MRNEAPFVLEWVAHHRAIGFTDFLIYTNDCEDGTDRMLEHLPGVTHVPNPRKGDKPIQWQALARASKHPLVAAADWIMVADVDEFVNIHAGEGTLADLFSAVPEAQGFALAWRLFGAGGQGGYADQPVTTRFTQAAPPVMLWPFRARCYKTLWRNDGCFAKLGVHRPKQPDPARYAPQLWVDGSGRTLPQDITRGMLPAIMDETDQYALAQVNHYATGSAEDFLIKRWRGKPNHEADEIGLDYWIANNQGAVKDVSITRTAAIREEMLAQLRADPTLAALHAEAVAWRRAKIAELLEDEAMFGVYQAILQTGPSLPLPLPMQHALLRHHNRLARARRGLE
ncbi:hypothetical protein FHS89_002886 [Rubricella aquisinus]|uniref:Glycosyl transferase family 2 n=1 Tax=Rubricella aquisinus TaxID=2028108 RepID=A0A840X221_9RHOB|nr:glycosyltransferase family 2 protein [Rubricella aquisinus]MBB5516844.1 hypothetical protein [Rubricella aquisinus]